MNIKRLISMKWVILPIGLALLLLLLGFTAITATALGGTINGVITLTWGISTPSWHTSQAVRTRH